MITPPPLLETDPVKVFEVAATVLVSEVVTVGASQSLFDLALQYFGDVSKSIEILKHNNNYDNMESVVSGEIIQINSVDNSINLYFKNINIACKYPEILDGYITTDDGIILTTDDGLGLKID